MSAPTASGTFDPSDIRALVIAGWTGRDTERVEAHVRELEAEGIPRPPRTPMFYELSPSLLTTDNEVTVIGEGTSGEVECVLVFRHDGLWVGLGSDHTDRSLERTSVAKSKQVCAKVVAPTLWRLPDVAAHWDRLELTSYIDVKGTRTKYQSGTAAAMLPTQTLIEEFAARGGEFSTGTAMFCGTLATLSSVQNSSVFEMQLHDPVHDRTIRHSYAIHVRSEGR